MSIDRVFTLLSQEFKLSLKGFVLFFTILTPLLMSVFVTLVFGRMFMGTPKIGVLENETSEMVELMGEDTDISFYPDREVIIEKVTAGKIEMGILFAPGFDTAIRSGSQADLTIYFWGGCPILKRNAMAASYARAIMTLSGRDTPVTITPRLLGNMEAKPWFIRLLPLLVLLSIMMSGLLIPSTTLVAEKQKGTLQALLATPASLLEVQIAKTLFGFILSFSMGFLILVFNGALGQKPAVLLLVLALAALTSATLGSLFGYAAKNVMSAMNIIKSLMLIIYAPAVLNFFPQVPAWVQKLFPTYYIFSPILKLSEGSFQFAEDSWEILVLMVVLVVLLLILGRLVKRNRHVVPA